MLKALGPVIILCVFGMQTSLARAGDTGGASLDAASTDALAKTQQMLQDPEMRNKVVGDSASAQTVDSQVKSLAGNPQATDEIYKISGQVLEDLVKETGGDPLKMMQIMNQAQSDPKGFLSHISQQNKDAIHSVAGQIDSAPTTRQPANAGANALANGAASATTPAPASVTAPTSVSAPANAASNAASNATAAALANALANMQGGAAAPVAP